MSLHRLTYHSLEGPLDPEEAGICMDSLCELVGCEEEDCDEDHEAELRERSDP